MLAVVASCTLMAQDARNRAASTIVADALAQLPARNQKVFDEVMNDLASTGAEGVVQLTGMLVPADKGENNKIEYALNGLIGYVHQPGMEAQRDAVREGLKKGMETCTDNPNRAFILFLLQRCGTAADAPFFARFVEDPYLQEWAINGLTVLPDSDDTLLEVIKAGKAPRDVLAYAAGKRGLKAAEPIVAAWAAEAAAADGRPFYKALGEIGSASSLPILAKAAKAQNYSWEGNSATESYLRLIERLAADEATEKVAAAEAAKLLKVKDKTHVRGAASNVLFATEGKKALPLLLAAMKDNDRAYRVNALRRAEPWADTEVYAALGKIVAAKGDKPVKADIINWFGTNHVDGQIDAIIANFGSKDAEIADAAIKAASKIGGDKALNALVAQLDGPRAATAEAALMSFNGKVNPGIVKALDGNAATQAAALKIASARRMTEAAPKVFALMNSQDASVAAAAAAALAGVVGPADFDTVCKMLETASEDSRPALSDAMLSAVRNLPGEEQYAKVMPYIQSSAHPEYYYPVLAQSNTAQGVAILLDGYKGGKGAAKDAALKALLTVEDPGLMIHPLYDIAVADKNGAAMVRYATLVGNSDFSPERKYVLYRKGIENTTNAHARNVMLRGLASTNLYPAMMVAANSLTVADNGREAAEAVRAIASKNTGSFGGAPVRAALEQAREVYKAGGSADDGYAIDDVNGILAELPEAAFVETEIADLAKPYENFEMLFEYNGRGALGVRSGSNYDLGTKGVYNDEWNPVYVKVVNDRITLVENGVVVLDNATLVGAKEGVPAADKGVITLTESGAPVEFRDIYIRELPSTPLTELSAEEKAEGFELLFDGRSMHNFMGNTTDYIPVDGNILVSAQYGSGGNLYTKKEYSDFIFRFEFCFDVEGVNNGIGIRTPTGVDAAYGGMEIQVLDHDAPIYKGLREYQVHGSVYGIIPAKRIVHKPRGEWGVEEIRAEGDHITVTVNGEVIVDGNIREACQGHNVDPDGGDRNPYTVDHLNHPGLFNKSGHIGFLGHGSGVKFRNIRVKDLSKGKKDKK